MALGLGLALLSASLCDLHAEELDLGNKAAATTKAPVAVKGASTGLPVPRFVSLKSAKINVRRGPGPDYPIEWVFAKRGLPVEVTAESNRWRRIRDRDGAVGWVWHGMLDGRRTAIIEGPGGEKQPVALHAEPLASSPVSAYAEAGVIAEIEACKQDWCRLKVARYEGWVPRTTLWGVYTGENFE